MIHMTYTMINCNQRHLINIIKTQKVVPYGDTTNDTLLDMNSESKHQLQHRERRRKDIENGKKQSQG